MEIVEADFLWDGLDARVDFAIGNPPYVPITQLDDTEKIRFKARFTSATERFDLCMHFIERALELLAPGGRLVFITPEKYTSVASAAALRRLVDGATWRPFLHSAGPVHDTSAWPTLGAFCLRISCGLATGADRVFVVEPDAVPPGAAHLARPTLAGRALDYNSSRASSTHRMLVPYDQRGTLLPEHDLGALGDYLRAPDRKRTLEARTCAARKPWYAFHDSVPLREILRPKILCKDISDAQAPAGATCRGGELASDQRSLGLSGVSSPSLPRPPRGQQVAPFGFIIAGIVEDGYHNHRQELQSDILSGRLFPDLVKHCPAFREDARRGAIKHWLNVEVPGMDQKPP